MARTQAADYDAKREAITDAAAKLFAEKGFAGASVSDLAERCAVSKSLIYHYYASKEAILFDVMKEHIDDLLGVTETRNGILGNPQQEIHALTKELLQHYVGAADRQKVLLYELSSLPAENQTDIKSKQRRIIAHVESLIGAAKPELAKNKARLSAKTMLFFGMLNWTHTWFKAKGGITRDELAEMAAETILGAL
ncbi:TetR/AcrR family transcriptional regulator [Hyphococcus flavus]|uniref:TetR/AcrR family transcriptional regulator n=1 Tax=Hyphococcus flavus TaxID=1866326 RepID=A0AAF0CET1_9PROT|nr:TetR/AcrR family transcriptional regulator [Hyphococcus flavus]WDI30674.1 TetR/AcrR family transcriptional regulator [Hyphococcus flavus]